MDKKLSGALAQRFTIFARNRGDLFSSFGFECGPGWVPLLIEFAEQAVGLDVQDIQVSQIKEKWNTLRVYVSSVGPDEDRLEDLAEEIEVKSAAMCEVCGKTLDENQRVATGTRCDHDGLDVNTISQRMLMIIENTPLN